MQGKKEKEQIPRFVRQKKIQEEKTPLSSGRTLEVRFLELLSYAAPRREAGKLALSGRSVRGTLGSN